MTASQTTSAPSSPENEIVPIAKGSHVYLIDGSGFIFRAFHALPPLTRPSDGLPVGAVHGFCNMLWKLLQESKLSEAPTHLAVVFDAGRETFRNDIYEKYKANRPPPPDELIPQFALIRDAVRAFNVACIEQNGYEADDLIATYTRDVIDRGGDVTIVSSDKDLMQLIRPGVVMLDGMKAKKFGRDEVLEKFGVPPEKVIDVQALAGDSVDNVPGVPGIGVKTAAELINEYGDLDALLARAGEIKQPKRREKLIEFAEQARISRELVKLMDDVPGVVAVDTFGVRDPHPDALIGFLRLMEFNTLTRRIADKLGIDTPASLDASVRSSGAQVKGTDEAPHAPPVPIATAMPPGGMGSPRSAVEAARTATRGIAFDRMRYATVSTLDDLEAWIAKARAAGRIAFNAETTSNDALRAELVGVSLALAPGEACYVPVMHGKTGIDLFGDAARVPGQIAQADVMARLKPLLEDPSVLKIGHNLKYDALVLGQHGITIAPFDDTMLMSYALDAGRGGHAVNELTERHLGHLSLSFDDVIAHAPGAKKADKTFSGVPLDKATEYAAEHADATLRLWMILKARLGSERVATVYETLERPLIPVIAGMEREGIKVDCAILSRLSGAFAQRAAENEALIYELAGQKFNLGSPKQLGEFLFDTLKLPGGKKTKSGQWETRAGLLDDLAANEDLPPDARRLMDTMLQWRQLTKLRSTYTDALPGFVHPQSGRIHTCYALAATTTGRLSSSEPNLQNIPIRTKEGREIRTAFIADKGRTLVSADYSQIELRVLAHIASIPQLRTAFADGLDIHAMTASEMFGVPLKDMTSEVRRRAKAINFGIIYGISAFGLANQLGISREEAGAYIKTYFERFPGIRDYMEETKKFAHANGYVETLFGRRIHYPEINTKNPSIRGNLERAAINAPIQGSAADIIRRAMIRVPSALTDAGLMDARMLLQVHDELVFEVAREKAGDLVATARAVMERAAEPAVRLTVPVQVDAKFGDNWEAAH